MKALNEKVIVFSIDIPDGCAIPDATTLLDVGTKTCNTLILYGFDIGNMTVTIKDKEDVVAPLKMSEETRDWFCKHGYDVRDVMIEIKDKQED